MSANTILALATAIFSFALAAAAACRKPRSLATTCFSAGMLIFALENLFGATWHEAVTSEGAAFWQTLTLVTKSFVPGIWLCFSLTYSRRSARMLPARTISRHCFVNRFGNTWRFSCELIDLLSDVVKTAAIGVVR